MGVLGGGALDLGDAGARVARPAARVVAVAGPPSQEESTPLAMPRYAPLIRGATRESKLPCAAGTTQVTEDRSLVCRAPAKPGFVPSKEGPSLWFHKNGKLAQQGQYAKNKRVGHWWTFRDDATLEEEQDYVDGEPDGVHVTYFASGKRRTEGHYRAGKLHGLSKRWDESGELRAITRYDDGEAVERRTFGDGGPSASRAERRAS